MVCGIDLVSVSYIRYLALLYLIALKFTWIAYNGIWIVVTTAHRIFLLAFHDENGLYGWRTKQNTHHVCICIATSVCIRIRLFSQIGRMKNALAFLLYKINRIRLPLMSMGIDKIFQAFQLKGVTKLFALKPSIDCIVERQHTAFVEKCALSKRKFNGTEWMISAVLVEKIATIVYRAIVNFR